MTERRRCLFRLLSALSTPPTDHIQTHSRASRRIASSWIFHQQVASKTRISSELWSFAEPQFQKTVDGRMDGSHSQCFQWKGWYRGRSRTSPRLAFTLFAAGRHGHIARARVPAKNSPRGLYWAGRRIDTVVLQCRASTLRDVFRRHDGTEGLTDLATRSKVRCTQPVFMAHADELLFTDDAFDSSQQGHEP